MQYIICNWQIYFQYTLPINNSCVIIVFQVTFTTNAQNVLHLTHGLSHFLRVHRTVATGFLDEGRDVNFILEKAMKAQRKGIALLFL
jgi:hypothetical protein